MRLLPNAKSCDPKSLSLLSPTSFDIKPPLFGITSAISARVLAASTAPSIDLPSIPSTSVAKAFIPSPNGLRSAANEPKDEPPVIHFEARSNNPAPVRINIASARFFMPDVTLASIPLTPSTKPDALSQNLDRLSPINGNELLIPEPIPPTNPPMKLPSAMPIDSRSFPPSAITSLSPGI